MKISNEGILTQLGYNIDEKSTKQLENIEKNTPGFENIKKHIVALNDHLKHLSSYVAMSNSNPYFKIKIDTENKEFIEEAKDIINRWAQKYNVNLQKVQNKETYYILGIQK
ncbi:hypothetical protein [Nitrosophilus labii]|uniref:hypothetical protein n=1 Tax=Nitrosophilus labii TaxID=2706014 RepID=UPI0018D86AB0|nr:hypothetical protein [Nitrosophilus labii]